MIKRTILFLVLALTVSIYSSDAEIDTDGDGMPDEWEKQYMGEIMFEDHFEDGILNPQWVMKLAYCEEENGRLYTKPEPLPGFNYGHFGHGRGHFIVLHEGDETWRNYSYEFRMEGGEVSPSWNPHGVPLHSKANVTTNFRIQAMPESWNEPSTHYGFSLQCDAQRDRYVGNWNLNGYKETYWLGQLGSRGTGYGTGEMAGKEYHLASGNKGTVVADINRTYIMVNGPVIRIWINGTFIGEAFGTTFTLTQQSLDGLEKEGTPETVLEGIARIKDQKFTKETLVDALQKLIGEEQMSKYQDSALQYAIVEEISPYGGISLFSGENVVWFDDVVVRAIGLHPEINDADFDYDGDGVSNFQEYERGTDPLTP